jgi:hypothetical protein
MRHKQQKDATLLSAWNSKSLVIQGSAETLIIFSDLYTTVDDVAGLENLETMMDGQSHRANRAASRDSRS